MLRSRSVVLVVAASIAAALATVALSGARDDAQRPARWWRPPADVRAMLAQVNARSLERTDTALVGFGTRHTLSSQDDPNRGIGAARDYIKARFDEIAATSGGRMTTELQSFVQPVSSRIPTPTTITTSSRPCTAASRARPTASTSSAVTTTRASPTC
jgi:hypothetical protein